MCDETIVLGIPCEQCGADSEEPEFFEHDDEWNVLEEETGAELEMALCHGCGAPGEECSCPTGEKEAMACGTCGRDRADCRCRELYEQKPTKPRERLSLIIDRIRHLAEFRHPFCALFHSAKNAFNFADVQGRVNCFLALPLG
eukprot:gene3564-biopygen3752